MNMRITFFILLCYVSFFNYAQVIQDTSNTIKKYSIKPIYNSFKKETIYTYCLFDTTDAAKEVRQNKSRSATPSKLSTPTISEVKNYYLIRIVGKDEENNINFYGLSIGGVHENQAAIFSGLAINISLGNHPIQGKPDDYISINGINFSFISTGITGTINGFSFGGLWGNEAGKVNGIAMGILRTSSDSLNGISIGGFGSASKFANALQVGGIMNLYCKFNGIGIAAYNGGTTDLCGESSINGMIFGIYNNLSVNGLSIGIVNNGNSWLQIGLVNIGDSAMQIGLINLDENYKIRIPFINVNF